MQVEMSSVAVTGGTIDYPDQNNSNNLGLILGICIPVGILSNFIFYF